MLKQLVFGLMLGLAIPAANAGGEAYDIVIRGGRVLDGAGNPWVAADVAIKGDRIVKIGRIVAQGAREIDARGKYVSPGWIDMMDQSGEALRIVGLSPNKINMGVTTLIGGEGGTNTRAVGPDEIAGF